MRTKNILKLTSVITLFSSLYAIAVYTNWQTAVAIYFVLFSHNLYHHRGKGSTMIYGTYCGEIKALQGQTAVIRDTNKNGVIEAQFDNLNLGPRFTYTWIEFDKKDFIIEEF